MYVRSKIINNVKAGKDFRPRRPLSTAVYKTQYYVHMYVQYIVLSTAYIHSTTYSIMHENYLHTISHLKCLNTKM